MIMQWQKMYNRTNKNKKKLLKWHRMFNFFAGSIELENVSGNILFLLFQLPVKIQHPIEKYEWFPKWNIGEWLLPALMIIDHFS